VKNLAIVIYLFAAGSLLLVIGTAILFAPNAFHGNNGIALGSNPNLLSEIRAPGALLAASGILILMGAFRNDMRSRAAQISVLVYGSFGIARVVSIALDGMPSSSLIGAMVLEFTVAILGLAVLSGGRASALRPVYKS